MITTRGYDVARWLMRHLSSPADTTQPLLTLTPGQIDFLADFYALDGDRYLYRRAALQQAKGWASRRWRRSSPSRSWLGRCGLLASAGTPRWCTS
jgi:hypothetical protein